jgi:hypothetical protein
MAYLWAVGISINLWAEVRHIVLVVTSLELIAFCIFCQMCIAFYPLAY